MNQLEQRVRIQRRLGRYLERQRDALQGYVALLEQERGAIASGDADRLGYYAALEGELVAGLAALGRVIEPLDGLYRRTRPPEEPAITGLRDTLRRLGEQARIGNQENRSLLRDRLAQLRLEITEVSRLAKPAPSPYASIGEPRLVDIRS